MPNTIVAEVMRIGRSRSWAASGGSGALSGRLTVADADIPVFPTIASQFNDPGLSWMFRNLCEKLVAKCDLDAAA